MVFGDGEGEGHVLFALLDARELVGPDFAGASEDGDVEVFTIVIASTVVVIGPVTADVNLEITAEFTVFSHEKALVKVGLHAEAEVDVNDAVVLLFTKFSLGSRFGIVVSKVRPSVGKTIVIEVHGGVVGIGLLRVFWLSLLSTDVAALNGCEQHEGEHERHEGLSTHGKSTR